MSLPRPPASVIPLLVFLSALGACRNLDVVSASYATLGEAERAGAVAEGWIPAGLPAGAHEIREAHGTESKQRWALFSFRDQDEAALKRLLEPTEITLQGQVCDAPGRIEWWPILLRGELDDERIRATGLQAYRSADGFLVFAVNWKQRRAYYWTPASRGTP
jgi:hypothetical protein